MGRTGVTILFDHIEKQSTGLLNTILSATPFVSNQHGLVNEQAKINFLIKFSQMEQDCWNSSDINDLLKSVDFNDFSHHYTNLNDENDINFKNKYVAKIYEELCNDLGFGFVIFDLLEDQTITTNHNHFIQSHSVCFGIDQPRLVGILRWKNGLYAHHALIVSLLEFYNPDKIRIERLDLNSIIDFTKTKNSRDFIKNKIITIRYEPTEKEGESSHPIFDPKYYLFKSLQAKTETNFESNKITKLPITPPSSPPNIKKIRNVEGDWRKYDKIRRHLDDSRPSENNWRSSDETWKSVVPKKL